MVKMGSKPAIFTTIVVLGLIIFAIQSDKIPTNALPTLIDSKYISFYKKACELNDAEACNDLGQIYDLGKGDERVDYEEALIYYGRACNLDNATGCNNLAYLYNTGQGIEKHNGYALRYYKRACDLGDLEGCYNLGAMYYRGEGTRPSKYKATKLFRKVCDKGVGAGCNDLAYMYAHGIHLRRDLFEAISLYNDACQYGEASGCNNLGNMYETGSLGVAKDKIKAEQFFDKACKLNDVESCKKLGYVLDQKIQTIQFKSDIDVAHRACQHDNGISCYKLGELYAMPNKLVPKDEDKAILFFNKACDLGQSQSCRRIGDFHRNGNSF